MKSPKPLLPLEHELIRKLKLHRMQGATLLLAVSGGRDSMVLLQLFERLKKIFKFQLHVLHVHHGAAAKKQKAYRDKAALFVQKKCKEMEIPFHLYTYKDKPPLKSEEDFRN